MYNSTNLNLCSENSGKKTPAVGRTASARSKKAFSRKPEPPARSKHIAKTRAPLSGGRDPQKEQAGIEGEIKVGKIINGLPRDEYEVITRLEHSGIILKDAKSKSGTREFDQLVLGNNGVCIVIEVKNWSEIRKSVSKNGKIVLMNKNQTFNLNQIRWQKEVLSSIIPNARIYSVLCIANDKVELPHSLPNDECFILKARDLPGFIQTAVCMDRAQNGSARGITRLEMTKAIYENRLLDRETANDAAKAAICNKRASYRSPAPPQAVMEIA